MRNHLVSHILFISFVFISVQFIQAAEKTRGIEVVIHDSKGKQVALYKGSYALVIGVSDYNAGWPKLPGVQKDVLLVRSILEEHGFNVVMVKNPDHKQLDKVFKEFISDYGMEPENRLLFYFAGHGHTVKQSYGEETGYIVPIDAPDPSKDLGGFLNRALDMRQIEVYAKRIQSKHGIFLFDSCFSGSIFAISRAIPTNISYKTSRPVRQFITSGSANEEVPDVSIFRKVFVSALEGEGDVNEDGYVTGAELGEYLQSNVVNYSKGAQHPQYGKIIHPHLDKGDYVFALKTDVSLPPDIAIDQDDNYFEEIAKVREESKVKWDSWQGNMSSRYSRNNSFDSNNVLKPSEKVKVWERFLTRYSTDNPYSADDQMMRSRAMDRMKYWKNYKEPGPAENQQAFGKTYTKAPLISLRTSYRTLSSNDVKSMLKDHNIFDKKKNKNGNFQNDYDLKEINGDKVVIDYATGLMWHQSGSEKQMSWKGAKQWVADLNRSGYVGYRGWRLPTLEEAASLIESEKKNGNLYIDPVFAKQQKYIWTGDKYGSDGAWDVLFNNGEVRWSSTSFRSHVSRAEYYVRPVRSDK